MKIVEIKKHSEQELIAALRRVSLLHNTTVFPYQHAQIQLDNIAVKDIHPSQFYYLEDAVLQIRDLENALQKHGVDLFHINGYLTYKTFEGSLCTLLPPIVEYQTDQQGNIVPLLNDGIHRILYAQRKGKEAIQVVSIRHADEKYPLMGYPNPNGWRDVKAAEKVPEPKDKRIWRVPVEQGYMLYRNFNSVFESVGKPRLGK